MLSGEKTSHRYLGTYPCRLVLSVSLLLACFGCRAEEEEPSAPAAPMAQTALQSTLPITFEWTVGEPLKLPAGLGQEPGFYSLSEATLAHSDQFWYLFGVVRTANAPSRIEYLRFSEWDAFGKEPSQPLPALGTGVRAPQLFRLSSPDRWCLVFQQEQPGERDAIPVPYISFSPTIDDPNAWSKPLEINVVNPVDGGRWRDFWMIFDQASAYLFFTDSAGILWRSRTSREAFPSGWNLPEIALKADIFQSAQVYRIQDKPLYLAIAEGHSQWRRYYKAYVSDRLDGNWQALSITRDNAFVSMANVTFTGTNWTDSFSHGELVRLAADEFMQIDLSNLRFIFQGVGYLDRDNRLPAQVPWRLAMLQGQAVERR